MATLTEHKSETELYFVDESGQMQGEYKWWWYSNWQLGIHCYYVDGKLHGEYKRWHPNGQLATHCFYVDGNRHGECKAWYSNGQLWMHCFYQNCEVVVDFFKDPALYPSTDEDKTYFALKYGWTKWL
jgi:antitoxin component YwqK of YwqJK toxin-antitoxin module